MKRKPLALIRSVIFIALILSLLSAYTLSGAPAVSGSRNGNALTGWLNRLGMQTYQVLAAAPTDITLSNSTIAENSSVGTEVGTFTTTDPDEGEAYIYTLVAGDGGTDNALFQIVDDALQTNSTFDFESQSDYSIRVQTDDGTGGTFAKAFDITITNVNEAPTDIALDNSTVAEHLPVGTTVGAFTTTDPDVGQTHTYMLVAGTGDTDNGSFQIDGSTLKTNAVFDFETKAEYSIRVQTNDGTATYSEAFTITISDGNDPPTDISLSNSTIAENEPPGTDVGTFSTTDPNGADSFTYSLVAGTGDTDNGSFQIDGATLKTNTSFNYEVKSIYNIRAQTSDSSGSTYEEAFTITVTNVNEPPTNITLSPSSVNENVLTGTDVGTFTTTDPDLGDTFTYSFATGTGDVDNGKFLIDGTTLKTNTSINYETKTSYSILVQTKDSDNATFTKALTITVNDVNEPPTNITLSNSSVAENAPAITTVGTFSTDDPDAGESFTYSLVIGDGSGDNGSFQIVGNVLQTKTSFNYELDNSYSIRAQTKDSGNNTYEKIFTITITNVNEPPTDIELSFSSVAENAPLGTTVGTFSNNDPDADSTFTYTFVSGTGDTDNGQFLIDGSTLKTDAVFDFETKPSYSIRVQVSDGGFSTIEIFIITVIDVNDAPVGLSDLYEVNQGSTLTVAAPGVLSNDSDKDGDPITAEKLSDPAHGTLTFQANGSFSYTPSAGYMGLDKFTYRADDGDLTSGSIDVVINVKDASSPSVVWVEPVKNGDQLDVNGEVITLKVEATDDVSVAYVVFYRWVPNVPPPGGVFVDIGIDDEPPFEVQINTSILNYEFNEIRARAYDEANNPSFPPWIWLYRVPPTNYLYIPLAAGE